MGAYGDHTFRGYPLAAIFVQQSLGDNLAASVRGLRDSRFGGTTRDRVT